MWFFCCPREYRTLPQWCSQSSTKARTGFYYSCAAHDSELRDVPFWVTLLTEKNLCYNGWLHISKYLESFPEICLLQGLIQLLLWACQGLWQLHGICLHTLGLGQEPDSPMQGIPLHFLLTLKQKGMKHEEMLWFKCSALCEFQTS